MMNIHWYWEAGVAKTLRAQIAPWLPPIRPMGAIYYWPLFKIYGLNPLPFNIVRIVLLFAAACAFYVVAFRLSGSIAAAGLASMAIAYHGEVGAALYEGSFIYDVLCALFFFAALAYYLHCRDTKVRLTLAQTTVFLAMYLCALNSKEMAVSLPVILFMYECLHGGRPSWRRFAPVLAATGITVVFVLARTLGSGALANNEAYTITLTWARYSESTLRFMNTMLYTRGLTMPWVLGIYGAFLLAAALSKDRTWRLLWVWVMVTPLPIVFIPDRDRASLPIVLAGWAILFGILASTFIEQLTRKFAPARWPRRLLTAALVAALAAGYVRETRFHHRFWMGVFRENGKETQALIDQLQALNLRPKPTSTIVFLHDPFEGFDTLFVARLVWNDPTLIVFLQNHSNLSAQEIASVDYEFDFSGGKLILKRAPPN
jgi:hypothetical protein